LKSPLADLISEAARWFDGLGAECDKIENDTAIANTQDVDQFNISSIT
jgi:hypothetical protein